MSARLTFLLSSGVEAKLPYKDNYEMTDCLRGRYLELANRSLRMLIYDTSDFLKTLSCFVFIFCTVVGVRSCPTQ